MDLTPLKYKLQFPVTAYVKENGFLGLVSYNDEDDSLFITTKSAPEGEYAMWLRQNVETMWKDNLDKIKEFLKENNVTLVCECVDMVHDPHIIKYPSSRIYLLDVVYNELKFRKYSFEEMTKVADSLLPRPYEFRKERAYVIENWQDFYDWYFEVTDSEYLYHGRHIEGFVVEDAAGYMVKLKLAYYNFWKYMRGIAHETIRKGYIDPKKTSTLITPLANNFYGWLRKYRDEVLNANSNPEASTQEVLACIPRDICSLRTMFYVSPEGELFREE